jgi:hypothetical protein
MFIVIGIAQPAEGVNVYVVVPAIDVLMFEGLHTPAIPLTEVAGNNGGVLF